MSENIISITDVKKLFKEKQNKFLKEVISAEYVERNFYSTKFGIESKCKEIYLRIEELESKDCTFEESIDLL